MYILGISKYRSEIIHTASLQRWVSTTSSISHTAGGGVYSSFL